jgi:hypothetical protein
MALFVDLVNGPGATQPSASAGVPSSGSVQGRERPAAALPVGTPLSHLQNSATPGGTVETVERWPVVRFCPFW